MPQPTGPLVSAERRRRREASIRAFDFRGAGREERPIWTRLSPIDTWPKTLRDAFLDNERRVGDGVEQSPAICEEPPKAFALGGDNAYTLQVAQHERQRGGDNAPGDATSAKHAAETVTRSSLPERTMFREPLPSDSREIILREPAKLTVYRAASVVLGIALTASLILLFFRPDTPPAVNAAHQGQVSPGPESAMRVAGSAGETLVEPGASGAAKTLLGTPRAAAPPAPVAIDPAPVGAIAQSGEMARPKQAGLRVANLAAAAGAGDIPFPIEVTNSDSAGEAVKIAVAGLPPSARLNKGTRQADGVWMLDPAGLAGLKLTVPAETFNERVTVSLLTNAGVRIESLDASVDIKPAPAASQPAGNPETGAKARGLFEQGKARIADGDIAGARMFFKKSAEAGDAGAAVAMAATYDPGFIASLNVHGLKPDVSAARQWYQRAKDLGSQDAASRLEKLKSK